MNKYFLEYFVSMNDSSVTWQPNVKWQNGKLKHLKFGTLKCMRSVGKFKIFARKVSLEYYAVEYYVVNTATGTVYMSWGIYLSPILDKIVQWLENDTIAVSTAVLTNV